MSEHIYKFTPRGIFTKTSHLDDEILKMSMMRWSSLSQKKPKILISQHGGNYSVSNEYALGWHDYEISDKYYTWGYKFKNKHFPSNAQQVLNKFNFYNKEKNNYKKKYLTFILGANFPYDFQRHVYHIELYETLYKNRKKFLKTILDPKNVMFKQYYEQRYKQQDTKKIIKSKLNISSKNIKKDFNLIFQSKLLIFEYFSTLFFETINLDIPFIFIIDEKNFYFSVIGKKFIKFLKKNNLIFSSGDEAAKFINNINDLDAWWYNIDQIEYKKIKKLVANIEYNDLNYWLQQFKNQS